MACFRRYSQIILGIYFCASLTTPGFSSQLKSILCVLIMSLYDLGAYLLSRKGKNSLYSSFVSSSYGFLKNFAECSKWRKYVSLVPAFACILVFMKPKIICLLLSWIWVVFSFSSALPRSL